MAQVNPNDVATAAVQTLQDSIARLDALKQQPGADFAGLDAQIDALQARQVAIRDLALRTAVDSGADRQAIAAMNAAAAALRTEAATMKATATYLAGVANVLRAATALVAALAPFV